jgi:putative ABC transport system permease protein
MTIPGFILRNALRNKRRVLLTVLSVAFSLFLFTVLQTALRELTQPATSEESALRLVVRHRVSLANVLPARYQSRIEHMPGVEVCSRFTWFGGIYQDEKNFFPQFACEANKIARLFAEAVVDPKQVADFIQDRTACIVGIKTMNRFGWKIGDKITLIGTIWDCNPELTIRAVYREGVDETNLFFHHEYFDEMLGDPGVVGTFWLKARDAAAVPVLIRKIDDAFRNTDAETKTETERAFALEFVSMFGNIRMFVGSISTVIVFTMILVTASTMSMSVRERIRELSVVRTLGFNGRHVVGLIVAESLGLAVTGGFVGCFGAWALFNHVDIYSLSRGFFIKFEVTPHILAAGMLIAVVLGVVSCAVPAYNTVRMAIVDGLKELD